MATVFKKKPIVKTPKPKVTTVSEKKPTAITLESVSASPKNVVKKKEVLKKSLKLIQILAAVSEA
jgi:hypothetical protein